MPKMGSGGMAKGAKKEGQKTVNVFFDFLGGTLGIILGIGIGITLFIVLFFLGLYSVRGQIKAISEELKKL